MQYGYVGTVGSSHWETRDIECPDGDSHLLSLEILHCKDLAYSVRYSWNHSLGAFFFVSQLTYYTFGASALKFSEAGGKALLNGLHFEIGSLGEEIEQGTLEHPWTRIAASLSSSI